MSRKMLQQEREELLEKLILLRKVAQLCGRNDRRRLLMWLGVERAKLLKALAP